MQRRLILTSLVYCLARGTAPTRNPQSNSSVPRGAPDRIGAFGIRKGDYEIIAVTILRNRGHLITLESELAPNGVKTPDGWIDGLIMDIKATDYRGKWAIKKKFHNAGINSWKILTRSDISIPLRKLSVSWKTRS